MSFFFLHTMVDNFTYIETTRYWTEWIPLLTPFHTCKIFTHTSYYTKCNEATLGVSNSIADHKSVWRFINELYWINDKFRTGSCDRAPCIFISCDININEVTPCQFLPLDSNTEELWGVRSSKCDAASIIDYTNRLLWHCYTRWRSFKSKTIDKSRKISSLIWVHV